VGSRISTTAPSSAYPTQDGQWLLIAANSDRMFARLLQVMGQPQLAGEARFADNGARLENVKALDAIIADWTREHPAEALQARLVSADIPCCKAYTIEDCAADRQFLARGMVQDVYDRSLGATLHPGIVPHLPDNPGQIRWPGPAIGEHTCEVLTELAGLEKEEIDRLRESGAI
jgi:formyl-CoA transferase